MSPRISGTRHVLLWSLLCVCLAACGERGAGNGAAQVDLVVEYDTTVFMAGEEVDVMYTVNNRTREDVDVYMGQWRIEYALRLSEGAFAEEGQDGHYEVYGMLPALLKEGVAAGQSMSWSVRTVLPEVPGTYASALIVGSSVGQLSATQLIEVRDLKDSEAK